MIHIERHWDSDVARAPPQIHGFRVDVDGLSPSDLFELDRRAVQKAIDRYLNDRERLYDDPPPELENTTFWLVHGLARQPAARVWEDFHVYFLLSKLRILLSESPQSVEYLGTDRSVSHAIGSLCEEYDVEYNPGDRQTDTSDQPQSFYSFLHNLRSRLYFLSGSTFNHLQRWLLFFVFVFLRPFVQKRQTVMSSPVDIRFWLHPVEDHKSRLHNAPANLESRGHQVGFALYDPVAMTDVKRLISKGLETLRGTVAQNESLHANWYIGTTKFRHAIQAAPRLRDAIQRVADQAKDSATTPEFNYLAQQLNMVSTESIFLLLLKEYSIEGYAVNVNDDTLCHTQAPTALTSRLLALAGDQGDITTVAVAPHYFSDTRIGSRFTDSEVNGLEAVALPDMCVVFEPSSADTMQKQNIPCEIAIARDKIVAESYGNEEGDVIQERLSPTTAPSVSPPNDCTLRVLIILSLPVDNRRIVNAINDVMDDGLDIEVIFKPHPLIPLNETLFDGHQKPDFEVTAPDASLADLVGSCDVCIAMFSTAAFPALALGKPVVWVPFTTPNHVRMDLIDRVGIRADEPDDLADALEQLTQDETVYVEQARECAEFARSKLVPDADTSSLVDLIDGTIGS